MTKALEDPIENWSKIKFPLRFSYVNLKVFSKISNPIWILAQTRKKFAAEFLISFRIIKDFQYQTYLNFLLKLAS